MTHQVFLGCIADDYTGATDLASMLVRAGLRVIQCFGVPNQNTPELNELLQQLDETDAVVIALKTRSAERRFAIEQSLSALEFLRSLGCDRFYFKYCSTFDSTPLGNIGPVAESLAESLGVSDVWYCPAFPENGRKVIDGHCFVHGIPLNESGMKDHPLHPMTDSNLLNVLRPQCNGSIGLIRIVQATSELHIEQINVPTNGSVGVRHWIVDSKSDDDLHLIAERARSHRLLTGSSAMACPWARFLAADRSGNGVPSQRLNNASVHPADDRDDKGSIVILAGSCSQATRAQIANFSESHPVYQLRIATAETSGPAFQTLVDDAVAWVVQQLRQQHSPVLVTSSWDAAAVDEAVRAFGDRVAAEIAEAAFSEIARAVHQLGVGTFIVAGGETSGSVISALNVSIVRIGAEIAPGVPCIYPLRDPSLAIVLKSGNFGGIRFFDDAVSVVRRESLSSEVSL